MVQPTHLGTLSVAPSSSAAAKSADSFLKKVLIYDFFAKVAARRIIELFPASAHRYTHHKSAAAAAVAAAAGTHNSTTSRNASYASDRRGGSGSGEFDHPFKMDRPLNVFGRPLTQCGTNPMTGFYRDGYYNTGTADGGSHTVAAVVSQKWLEFSASKGNDLRPILSDGCPWCLCVSRWKQSFDAFKRGIRIRGWKGGSGAQDPARGGPIR
ncbi:uncharacterized protein UBRO2_01646 [Ustilago bromivora]|uniref:Uncharacterized protein n=1 Tax=Ustilago bromivora TaxID=307758 RepID=A0A8H8TRE6_9BASI|nr:uncharacterized protein UBRO2_01646 [Ustilago bromivora]